MNHSTHLPAPSREPAPRLEHGNAITFAVAQDLAEVIDAWRLVHFAYCRGGLINPNVHGVHTTPLAIRPNTAVICGRLRDEIVSTLTIMHDTDVSGLPLDGVYSQELNTLRDRGRSLLEVGLLADRREQMTRSLSAVLEMMRYVFYFQRFYGGDIVVGVHPHHAAFYERYFAFEIFGPEKTHPSVKDHPVVPLRLDLDQKLLLDPLPRGLAMYVANPLPQDAFASRIRLDAGAIAGTALEAYLGARAASTPSRLNSLSAA